MAAFATRLPDLAVIDISLEDEPEGGFELCRQLRAHVGGAADHLPHRARQRARRGFGPAARRRRLPHQGPESGAPVGARARAVPPRRCTAQAAESAAELLRRGPLTLDAERMQAQWDGQVVLLSLTEFWIVHALARHPGHVSNRQQLMDAANVVLDDNTITSHVKRIRRKFQALDPRFDALQTVYGMGYRWVEVAARDVPAPEAAAARTCDPGAAVGRLPLRPRDGVGAARGRGQLAPGRVADHRRIAAGAHRPVVPRAAPARRSGRRAAAGQRRAAGDRPGLRQARPR